MVKYGLERREPKEGQPLGQTDSTDAHEPCLLEVISKSKSLPLSVSGTCD